MSGRDEGVPPKRWVELEGPRSELLRTASASDVAPPVAARARVAARLSRSLAVRRGSSFMRFAMAGVAIGALIVLGAIQLLPERRVARVVASEGLVEVAGDAAALAVGDRVRVGASSWARIEIDRAIAIAARAETALVLSELDRRVGVRIESGDVEAIAREELLIAAGPWSVAAVAGRFEVMSRDRALIVEVSEGEVAIEGPERARVVAGGRFESKREVPVVAKTVVAPVQRPSEEPRKDIPRKPRPLRDQPPPPAPDEGPSEEQLYQQARDERDPTQAIALYDRVTAMRGSYAEIAAYQAARTAMKSGGTRDAIARFRVVLKERPNGVYAHEASLDLIECHLTAGELEDAGTELETFLRRYPESERNEELRFLRAELARMKQNNR